MKEIDDRVTGAPEAWLANARQIAIEQFRCRIVEREIELIGLNEPPMGGLAEFRASDVERRFFARRVFR